VIFATSGTVKVALPKEKLVQFIKAFKALDPKVIHLIGVLELLGAIGLIVPAVTGIFPWLTPLAAVGLIMTMMGAMVVNVQQKEMRTIGLNLLLLLLAFFVVYGRFVLVPF
jgi:uncharacterized membrane protein YphA (DoxX/SURF4 family)